MSRAAIRIYEAACGRAGIGSSDADALRRAAITLPRWYKNECGCSNDYANWAIERDESTGLPYLVTHPHQTGAKSRRRRIPDREKGARLRIAMIAARIGAVATIQCDPRGWPLALELAGGLRIEVPPYPLQGTR